MRSLRFKTKSKLSHFFLAATLFSLSFFSALAEVRVPALFSDHMVLQQGVKLPVWGWADPQEKVTVILGALSATTVFAGPDGAWHVELPPIEPGETNKPQLLTIQGKTNTITCHDVLIGDVWIASGQSNMEFGVRREEDQGAAAIAAADQPEIRLFVVTHNTALTPQKEIKAAPPDSIDGQWIVCDPFVMSRGWGWAGFSAVAYHFAQEIHRKTGHPIGMIGSYWGGTPAQAWTSLAALQKEPLFHAMVQQHEKILQDYDEMQHDYPKMEQDYLATFEQWKQEFGPDAEKAMTAWKAAAEKAVAAGQTIPPQPRLPVPKPTAPTPPDGGPNAPANLFNAMIAPLIPYAIKGVIWYQGESNANSLKECQDYATLFPLLITDWRAQWNQGDFPFLYVQLASYMSPPQTPSEDGWAELRESQYKTLSLPNTGMAVTIDIGDPLDIHPKDKADVGYRLALAARHVAYGQDLVYSGPMYDSMKVEGDKIRIQFKNIGHGLTIGVPPWTPAGETPPSPRSLTGFAIAGEDQKWAWATAWIEEDSVVVYSNQVHAPVAVRYGWANDPSCNLYNLDGLPTVPFRTDNWDIPAPVAP